MIVWILQLRKNNVLHIALMLAFRYKNKKVCSYMLGEYTKESQKQKVSGNNVLGCSFIVFKCRTFFPRIFEFINFSFHS